MKTIIRTSLILLMLSALGGCVVYPYDGYYGGAYYSRSGYYYPRYASPYYYYYPNYYSSGYYGGYYPSASLNIGISGSRSHHGSHFGSGFQSSSGGFGHAGHGSGHRH